MDKAKILAIIQSNKHIRDADKQEWQRVLADFDDSKIESIKPLFQ